MTTTCYADTLVAVPVIIPSGEQVTPVIKCIALPNYRGAGNLMRIAVPSGFPTCDMTFLTQDSTAEDAVQYPFFLTDMASLTVEAKITFAGDRQSIQLPPYAFCSVGYFVANLTEAVTEDTTVIFYFQPIFEGQNNV